MCKKLKGCGRRIDPCMLNAIFRMRQYGIKTLSCCCGHGRYPMSIVVKDKQGIYELFSDKEIPRKKRFYVSDKDGYYYIPEVINGQGKEYPRYVDGRI